MVEGLERWSSAPRVDALRLLRQYAFAYATGNADLHAKNLSLWRNPTSGLVELSPAYDVPSTLPYRAFDKRLAMRMDAKDDRFRRADFLAFGERCRLPSKAVAAMLDELVEALLPWFDRLSEIGFDEPTTTAMTKEMRARLDRLRPSDGGP